MDKKICPYCNAVNYADVQTCRVCSRNLDAPSATTTENAQTGFSKEPPKMSEQDSSYIPTFNQAEPENAFGGSSEFTAPEGKKTYEYDFNNGYAVPHQQENFQNSANGAGGGYISYDDFKVFTGSSSYAEQFISKKPKFNHIVFWCSLIFTPFVGSFWYFSKKLNSEGIKIAVCGAIYKIISVLLSAMLLFGFVNVIKSLNNSGLVTQAPDDGDGYYYDYDDENDFAPGFGRGTAIYDDNGNEIELPEEVTSGLLQTGGILLLQIILFAVKIVISALFASSANKKYQDYAVETILSLKRSNATGYDIAVAGANKNTLWIVLCVCYFVISFIARICLSGQFFAMIAQI